MAAAGEEENTGEAPQEEGRRLSRPGATPSLRPPGTAPAKPRLRKASSATPAAPRAATPSPRAPVSRPDRPGDGEDPRASAPRAIPGAPRPESAGDGAPEEGPSGDAGEENPPPAAATPRRAASRAAPVLVDALGLAATVALALTLGRVLFFHF